MRFYLDEDISPRVAEIARGRCNLDIVSAHEIAALRWTDAQQLEYAGAEDRCMVTCNRDDFIVLTVSAFEALRPHAGLLIVPYSVPNRRLAALAAALCDYANRHPDGMHAYTIDYL